MPQHVHRYGIQAQRFEGLEKLGVDPVRVVRFSVLFGEHEVVAVVVCLAPLVLFLELLLAQGPQDVDRLLVEVGDALIAVAGLGWRQVDRGLPFVERAAGLLIADVGDLPAHDEELVVQVHVVPRQAEQLPAAHAREGGQMKQGLEAMVCDRIEP